MTKGITKRAFNTTILIKFTAVIAFMAITLINFTAYAQTPPDPTQGDCNIPGGGGPDEPCPLDTWVYVLVFAFVIFGAYKMYQKQKALNSLVRVRATN